MPRLLCCRISLTRYSESARSSSAFRRRVLGTFQTHPNPGHYLDRIQEPVRVIAAPSPPRYLAGQPAGRASSSSGGAPRRAARRQPLCLCASA